MAICYIGCDDSLIELINSISPFKGNDIVQLQLPITASELEIEILIVGPAYVDLPRLAATICDWNLPPAALFILPVEGYDTAVEVLRHHPRMGRSVDFCPNIHEAIVEGIHRTHEFHTRRASLKIDNSVSGNFNTNNVSPRWLFQTMMEHLDEYIYFKDSESKFLAVSRYLAESCGKDEPSDVLGMRDFDLFDRQHAEDAYNDERKITTGEIKELDKVEQIEKDGKIVWVASRKLPLRTRSNFLAGSYGLSRDITEAKELHAALEKNHAHMQSELILARNLQQTLLDQEQPQFLDRNGDPYLEIETKYIPSSHLSGDFFSVSKTPEGGAAVMIADVMGHGVRAAMVTAMIQIAVNQLSDYATRPAEFLAHLNRMIHQTIKPSGHTIFATAAFGYLEPGSKKFTYAQAGARHGIHVPADRSVKPQTFDKMSTGSALGLRPDSNYTETSLPLQPGDRIVLYTDGILEASHDGEEYGEKRIIEFLAAHRDENATEPMINSLLNSVYHFTKTRRLNDDVCMIALKVP